MECVIDIPEVFKVRWMDGIACVRVQLHVHPQPVYNAGPGTWHTDTYTLVSTNPCMGCRPAPLGNISHGKIPLVKVVAVKRVTSRDLKFIIFVLDVF